jgi:hypothetical protein
MHPKLVNLKDHMDFRWTMNTYVCSLYFVLRIHILILLHVNKNLMKSLEWISFIYMTHHENHRSHADTDKNINPHPLSSILSFFVFIHTYIFYPHLQISSCNIHWLQPTGYTSPATLVSAPTTWYTEDQHLTSLLCLLTYPLYTCNSTKDAEISPFLDPFLLCRRLR